MAEEALPAKLHHLLSPSHPGKRKTLKKAIAKLITEDDEHTAKKRRQWLEMIEQARGGRETAEQSHERGATAGLPSQICQGAEQQQQRHTRPPEIAAVQAAAHRNKSQTAAGCMHWAGWNTQGLSRKTLQHIEFDLGLQLSEIWQSCMEINPDCAR